MNARLDTLVEQAKTLSAQERVELLDAPFDLVSPVDPAWEQAWVEECEDRAAAIDRGEMTLIQAEEVMAKYRGADAAVLFGSRAAGTGRGLRLPGA